MFKFELLDSLLAHACFELLLIRAFNVAVCLNNCEEFAKSLDAIRHVSFVRSMRGILFFRLFRTTHSPLGIARIPTRQQIPTAIVINRKTISFIEVNATFSGKRECMPICLDSSHERQLELHARLSTLAFDLCPRYTRGVRGCIA